MNLILLEPEEAAQEVVSLDDRRGRHIRDIHRAVAGDTLRVGVLGGAIGAATVQAVEEGAVILRLGALTQPPPVPAGLILCVALPRPPTLHKVLQQVTAMGVKELVFFHARRVEKSFWQSSAATDAGARPHLLLGLEQGRDTILPEVRWCRGFRQFVDEVLPGLTERASRSMFAHVGATTPCPSDGAGGLVVVGPEGGLIPFEVERLQAAGLEPVSLGARPLRVETACVSLAARLALC